jgi:polygalacturonase
MNRFLFLLIVIFLCFFIQTNAQIHLSNQTGTGILPAKNASHIAGIHKDTIIVISGSTYSFTVDTPEDQGLVSTNIGIKGLFEQIRSSDGTVQKYQITDAADVRKEEGPLISGDRLIVISANGKSRQVYYISIREHAIAGKLLLGTEKMTVRTPQHLSLCFTAGQRSPDATVSITVPAGIRLTMENTTVNVIGRGEVMLRDFSSQSIGRTGTNYSYSRVGTVVLEGSPEKGQTITFSHLDLRPANGPDLKITIRNVNLDKTGTYSFKARYSTSKPKVLQSPGTEIAVLHAVDFISDFQRIPLHNLHYKERPETYTQVNFKWSANSGRSKTKILQSMDQGRSWKLSPAVVNLKNNTAHISGLIPNQQYRFKLQSGSGEKPMFSNETRFYAGKTDVREFGIIPAEQMDHTEQINRAIDSLAQNGGGTLLFSKGIYQVRTIHLKSNVYLYVDKDAVIKAIKGTDAPESTWFSDKQYRSGLSPTDAGPYEDPENYLSKQDVGHHYFRNAMFFGERLDNVKIIGRGLITGNGNLVTGDKVMNNPPDHRGDKMFSFKLCSNLEIGGINTTEDLWYDSEKDEPYYLGKSGVKQFDTSNMLKIERAGHFALLATGTDSIHVHDTYFAKNQVSNARDIYDFMGCNEVMATNIYSRVSADDIIKIGSDCSLGFTRPAINYKVRNIIGDTNCNLFQIGSETADDISKVCIDNIYILAANKAGFSISTNDGAIVRDIHLNCGHTGRIHSRSKMFRTTAPFFISISNRGRITGAEVGKYSFLENGKRRTELLVKNVNIGRVEKVILQGIDISEVYGGSSYSGSRWKAYDGTQKRSASIIAGYQLPGSSAVEGGLNFRLPNGLHTGYVQDVVFKDIHILDKGGNPLEDASQTPPELGLGQYNVSNLKTLPAYGLWVRHAKGLRLENSSFNYEKTDDRPAVFLEDVKNARFKAIKMLKSKVQAQALIQKNSQDIDLDHKTQLYRSDL